jgi:hypothetical protein
MAHRRSLGFAPPDFLLRLVALANFMRLSLRERRTRYRVQRSVAGNPGRDDKKESVVERKGRLLNRGIFETNWTGLKFSRPCGTEFKDGVRTHALQPLAFVVRNAA